MSIEEKMLESLQCKLGRIDGGEREMRWGDGQQVHAVHFI
jgi:hypothetical protein